MVSSKVLNGFKVGIWGSSLKQLRSRYKTYYGRHLTIMLWENVDDHKAVEKDILGYFKKFSLGGELLDMKVYDECRRFIMEDWGVPTQIDS